MRIQTFEYFVDILASVLWQYNDATNLLSLLEQKQEWYNENQSEFWGLWYENIFDLTTCNLFGLAVWAIILDVPLLVPLNPEPPGKPIWGFNQIDGALPALINSYQNFENGNFSTKDQNISLSPEEERFMLRLRYFQLTTRASVTVINEFLNYLVETSNFGYAGTIYVEDNLDMTMNYVFTDYFPPWLLQALISLKILPKPAGVKIIIVKL